ncbi:MAG: hypothetical protein COX41_03370 [Candidatus Omnitrophica bacterium CG23_combo_of_CG06-09_8_20_14_all_41_10]|uniref:Four helix bundle protein n=1 Tax=Candidatus Sherwoodlollariibacterium unditelluris TaxID=1974757 RepID=A0A2G9YJE0_9BACT|nr:MAG: hypothetical protein COX41_03370 [Candidatus Omnitrophica bacterium CG23_combo_of_CG06-09_8_20_14_all_41_10]
MQSHLYVILDQNMISKELFENLYDQATKTSKLINGLIRNVNIQIAK